jgi:hypothetical protein
MAIQDADLKELEHAVLLLENPSFIARVTDLIGQPIERIVHYLPADTSGKLQGSVRAALHKLLDLSVRTMNREPRRLSSDVGHKIASGVSGAIGGFFGLPALAVELPITTSIMLRSIADIARSEGEDLDTLAARMACLEVFALGGGSSGDDGAETGYYAVRAALAKAVSDAVKHIAERGLTQEGAPAIARLVSQVASRFGSTLSEKIASQAVPVIGAIGGATVNLLFVDHFQDMARGHFIVRRLERRYGGEEVRREYQRIRDQRFDVP